MKGEGGGLSCAQEAWAKEGPWWAHPDSSATLDDKVAALKSKDAWKLGKEDKLPQCPKRGRGL